MSSAERDHLLLFSSNHCCCCLSLNSVSETWFQERERERTLFSSGCIVTFYGSTHKYIIMRPFCWAQEQKKNEFVSLIHLLWKYIYIFYYAVVHIIYAHTHTHTCVNIWMVSKHPFRLFVQSYLLLIFFFCCRSC